MPPVPVGVPEVSHCFSPVVTDTVSGSGLGYVCYVTLLKTLAVLWDSLGMWQGKTRKKNQLRNVCLSAVEKTKEHETKQVHLRREMYVCFITPSLHALSRVHLSACFCRFPARVRVDVMSPPWSVIGGSSC